ncbi:MAG: 3-oxoacyl-ACP synthase [Prevotella sp.]|nr:3-oxoacyl-ACP synthase [Prevotella sp.]
MVYKIADNILSPLGATTAENYQAVKAGRSALARHDQRWTLPDKVLTASLFSQEQEQQFLISGLSRFESMVVSSVREALSQTTLDVSQPNVILIISTTKGDVELLEESPEADHLSPADSAQRIARELGFATDPIVVCNACISGLSALILASRLLEDGQYEHAVVCGADSQSRFIVSGFQSLKALSPEPCRPFDMERMGLNLGEAAATMILSKGVGDWTLGPGAIRNDATHISNPAKNGEGSCLALKTIVDDNDKESLAFINAHGTATIFNDQMESVAIERAGLADIPVNAYKGCYGHTMGAAGVLETILSMTALDDQTILATQGFEELGVSGHISLSSSHQSTSKSAFVKMLSGFGGCNAALLLEKNSTRLTGGYHSPFSSHHSVVIRPDAVEVDGRHLSIDAFGKELLTALYRQYVGDYPKYYKMDPLSRLGFIASELLLQAEGAERFVACDDRAVIFFNHSSSVCADRQYIETIADPDNCFPSPSVFVYTLPNIVTGEIAIRNGYHGETSFYILPRQDDRLMQQILQASCLDSKTQSILCGWLDYEDDAHFVADLRILKKSVKFV